VNVVPVPDRFEKRIREAEEEQILHRLFSQIAIDLEN